MPAVPARTRSSFERRTRIAAIAVGAALTCLAAAPAASANPGSDGYVVVDHSVTKVGDHLVRTATTVQVGSDPINRFEVVHLEKDNPAGGERGAILLLPPISSGFENYEVGEDGDYDKSFAAFFAKRDYDVWGLSQRTHGLVAGSCESGAIDCSAMADWGMQTLIDDAGYVRKQIEALHPWDKPVIGGISLGSMAAVAMLDADPDRYAGAILQEGTLYDADPANREITAGFCAQFDEMLASGVYFDDQQLGGLRLIANLATSDPDGASPLPGFPPGCTNHQAFVAAMSAPPVGPITPHPGYYFLDGNIQQNLFLYADDALARANIAAFDDYLSLRIVRDVDCGLSGDTTFTSKLDKVRVPLFVNAGGHGFGPAMLDTLALMPKADAEVHFVEPFGHMDAFFAKDHRALTEKPIFDWLQREVFGQ